MHSFICSLHEGDIIKSNYLLKEICIGSTRAGSSYLGGAISDISGTIPIRIWNYSGSLTEQDCGKIVSIDGYVNTYRHQPQIICNSIEIVSLNALEHDEFQVLIPSAPIDIQQRITFLYKEIDSIRNRSLHDITSVLINKHWDNFIKIPAAFGVHHAFLNGLLMHVTDMAAAAEGLCTVYSERINHDLLLAGVILHDIGKTSEFTISEIGLVAQYSPLGKALGHSIIGIEEIGHIGAEIGADPETIMLLQNLLASHHGKPEYGAAASAITLEGELLHLLDSIDSRVEIFREALLNVSEGEFSPYIRPLSKQIYRPHRNSEPAYEEVSLSIAPYPPPGMSVEEYFDTYECWRHDFAQSGRKV